MRFGDLFRRGPEAHDQYTSLQDNLAEAMLDEGLAVESGSASPDDGSRTMTAEAPDAGDTAGASPGTIQDDDADIRPSVSEYAQARLADLAAFEHMHDVASFDLDAVSVAVAQIKIAQRQAKEFLGGVYSTLHRLSELETANGRLLVENRTLFRQAEHVNRLRSQQEGLVHAFKQREEKLVEAADAARQGLASVKLELAEAQAQLTSHLNERQVLQKSLATSNTQYERTMRENEVLRERLANFSADLEVANRRRMESERKLDEVAALQTRDASDNAELRQHLSGVETERQRLQKQVEVLQSKSAESLESLKLSESEIIEQTKRHEVGLVTLRNERDTLAARLEHAEKAHLEASQKVGALTAALDEALTRKRLIDDVPASIEPMSSASLSEVVVEHRNAVSKVRAQVAERVVGERGRTTSGTSSRGQVS